MDRDPADPETRHAQVLAECERLINRNAVLENRLSDAIHRERQLRGMVRPLAIGDDNDLPDRVRAVVAYIDSTPELTRH